MTKIRVKQEQSLEEQREVYIRKEKEEREAAEKRKRLEQIQRELYLKA